MKPRSKKGRSFAGWLGIAAVCILITPMVEVLATRFIDPPVTTLMLLRRAAAQFSAHRPRRMLYDWVPLRDIPVEYLKDVWIAEDQRFFVHHGFDWREIRKDMNEAERRGKPARGASTITMQCARSVFLWEGRSWIRKGLEAYYTLLMEAILSKKRILELYANVVEMGDGIYGVRAASLFYYGLAPEKLGREQIALLAGLLPNPRVWDPRKPSVDLVRREGKILRQQKDVRFPAELLR